MSDIYTSLCKAKSYDSAFQNCIKTTIRHLLSIETTVKKPGMLLGKIQGGKTNTYIGIIGLGFDKEYDLTLVLTKGTKALTKQTYERLDKEFEDFIEDDVVKLYDIMNIPEELTPYILDQKLILIAKKETHNLDRIIKLFQKYPELAHKRLLIIDDEADYASVGFKRDKKSEDEVTINTLAKKIDKLRNLGSQTSFLQVTATPYALYLQPETVELNGQEYHPIQPAFTTLVPIHDKYIGSEHYFEKSEDPESEAYYLHKDVPDKELQILGKQDLRYLTNILTTPNLIVFRSAIVNFLVAGSIRRLQESKKNYKSSFLIHTETSRPKHKWQTDLVNALLENLKVCSNDDPDQFEKLVKQGYEEFIPSVPLEGMPEFVDILKQVNNALNKGYIGVCKINSDIEVAALLDKKGQFRLDNPFNIFIGGQILDRGVTIDNLIGFFYGRNPRRFQQDTVLQHSRMYGARSEMDLRVTRFYTSGRIFDAMKRIHEFDTGLRKAFEKGEHEDGVVFLLRDSSGRVITCSPNKILISSTETIRPFRRFLPRGMQTKSKTSISPIDQKIESILLKYNLIEGKPFLMELDDATQVLNLISETYDYASRWQNENYSWDVTACIAILKNLCKDTKTPELEGKTYVVIRANRNSSRLKANQTFNDAPDDGQVDRPQARETALQIPILQLFKQNGKEANGWRGVPFWWPVLVCPKNTKTAVFASESL